MFKPLTRFSASIGSAERVVPLARKAFATAEGERPGATHLALPENIASAETAKPETTSLPVRGPVPPNKRSLLLAVKVLRGARRPVILIGMRANTPAISRGLSAFIQETGIPFATTQLCKGSVREDHPLYLGTTAVTDNDCVHAILNNAYLIPCVGHENTEKPPFVRQKGGPQVIHMNFTVAGSEPIYIPDSEIVGDIALGLRELRKHLAGKKPWEPAWFREGKREMDTRIGECVDSPRFPLLPQRIVADVRSAMPENGIVVLDNGMYKLWFARNYRAFLPNTLLLDNALATMGAGLPSAIAAKLLYPKRKVLAVSGDGGFIMSSQELETVVRLKLDLVVVIIRDDGFGMIQWEQEMKGFKQFGLSYGNPDFPAYAGSFGAKGYRVTKTGEFLPLLKKTLGQKGVSLIEVPVDYSENARVFTKLVKQS